MITYLYCINIRLVYADKNALVLEDLTSLNFELASRKERLNLKKAQLVLEKIAKFHAITAKLHENDPAIMERHMFSAYQSDEMTPLSFFLSVSMEETLETMRNSPDLLQYVPLLENFDIVEEEKKVFSRSERDRFHVLNHGDLWINNILFKYDEKKDPVDALLVSISIYINFFICMHFFITKSKSSLRIINL